MSKKVIFIIVILALITGGIFIMAQTKEKNKVCSQKKTIIGTENFIINIEQNNAPIIGGALFF